MDNVESKTNVKYEIILLFKHLGFDHEKKQSRKNSEINQIVSSSIDFCTKEILEPVISRSVSIAIITTKQIVL